MIAVQRHLKSYGSEMQPTMLYLWSGFALLACLVSLVSYVLLGHPLPRLLAGPSDVARGAAIIGVSIVFTGIIVSYLVLMFLQRTSTALAASDLKDARSHVRRGLAHAAAIAELDRKASERRTMQIR